MQLWPRKLKTLSNDWQNSDTVATLEPFLFSSWFAYIISYLVFLSLLTNEWTEVRWVQEGIFLKLHDKDKLGPGFEPISHTFCHFTPVPPKLLPCAGFPRGWGWVFQQTQVFWGRLYSFMLPAAAGHSLSVCLTQELFGRNGFEYRMFQLFQSSPKDLLFSDDTECLANLQDTTTYQKYLGPEYLMAIANVKQCLSFGE